MKRKILSLILVFAMTVSLLTVGTGAVEPTYGDTAGHWAESSIERWSAYGIIQGSNDLFDPNGQLTCAQLATILAKLLKLPAAKDAGFTDNTADAWYYDAVNRCAAAGILNGNGDSTVTPEAPITRERAIVMLGRALGIQPIRESDLTKYTDAAKVAPYAQGMVAAMIKVGIVGGVTADELAPQDNINRASTVTILDRAISTYADQAGTTVKADGKGIVLVVADDVTVTGDVDKLLVPADNVDVTVSGSKNIDDITVTGDNSKVILNNSTANDVTLDGKNTELETKGGSKVENVSVTEDAKGATVNAGSGTTVKNVENSAADTTVTGSGSVKNVASDTDVTVETKGTEVKNTGDGKITVTDKNGKDSAVNSGSSSTTTGGTTSGGSSSGSSGGSSGGSSTPSHSHVWAAGWTYDGTHHWHNCTAANCTVSSNEGKDGYAAHNFTYTDNGDGTHTKSCSECGYSTLEAHSYDESTNKCICGLEKPADNVVASVKAADGTCTYYPTLAGAVAAAADGGIVTLLNSQELSANLVFSTKVTLNLNGQAVETKGYAIQVQGSGDLTVTGNGTVNNDQEAVEVNNKKNYRTIFSVEGETAKLTIENGTFTTKASQAIFAEGTVTIHDGTFQNTAESVNGALDSSAMITAKGSAANMIIHKASVFATAESGNNGIYGIYGANGAHITLEDGVEVHTSFAAIGMNNTTSNPEVVITVNGGTYKSECRQLDNTKYSQFNTACYLPGKCQMTINGGTFTVGNENMHVFSIPYAQAGTNLTIKDGTFIAGSNVFYSKNDNHENQTTDNKIVVSGGSFTGTIANFDESNTFSSFITGGTFSSDPSEYVAERYAVTRLEGGKYQVVALFAGGTGTADDPFVIQNAEQLKAFRNNVNAGNTFAGKTIKLTRDINLKNEEWTPIGTNEHPFSGSFDGQNHTVSNLKITNAGSYNGLFGKVVGIPGASFKTTASEVWNAETYTLSNCEESQFNTIIKNFNIQNFTIWTGEYGAAAIGWAENAYISKISVSSGSVNDNNATNKGKIAAVVGVSAKNMVYDQLTTAEGVYVGGGKHSVAGIVSSIQRGNNGQPHLVVIKNCVNNAEVSWSNGNATGRGYPIAGIVANAGSCDGLQVVIYQCTNNGRVVANECDYACGIVGQAGDWVKAIYDCRNAGTIEAKAAIGVAGICITESIPAIACSNTGDLINHIGGGHTYDISSSISQLTIVNETFADVSALQARINNAVGTAKTLILKDITVTDPTGTLTIPDGIQHISANTKVCDSISLPDALVNIDMIRLTQTVTGTVCRTFSGSGNRITVEANTTIGDIVIAGTDNAFTNNGTMGNVAISGNGTDIVINNESGATMAGMTMIATTATATLNNQGTMNRTAGGHCVWVEANGTLTVNNHGSISATGADNNYALLFYGNCTIIVNAYNNSTVTHGFAPYSGTHTITVNYQTGATYNGGSWTNLPDYSQYGVAVSVMP